MSLLPQLTERDGRPVSLRGTRLSSHLAGMSNQTLVEQTFVNQESVDIEAVYTFPLPPDAAIHSFEVLTDGRVLTGQVEEEDAAIDLYDSAIGHGDAAYMLEQQRPDVYTIRVGNIKPRQAVTIRLSLVAPLELTDGRIRLAFPTTIAPRYATDSGVDPLEAMIDSDALNPPHCLCVPYGLAMTLNVSLGVRMKTIVSPSHAINVEGPANDSTTYRVTLSAAVAEMDRDVVVELEPEKANEPNLQICEGPDGASYAAVTFLPEFDEEHFDAPETGETIFVLDCSGSMQGQSIEQAKRALELCLRSLATGEYFNIWRFGWTFAAMATEPLCYDSRTLQQALDYISGIDADLGGTELFAPLEGILRMPTAHGGPRQVILLTDGQVTNEPVLVELARKSAAQNRIFTFGIGPASSAYLVNGLARATRGSAEFITPGERIEPKVLRTFSRIASPRISDLQIDWEDAKAQLACDTMPHVLDGDVLKVLARFTGEPPRRVTLRCKTSNGDAHWTVDTPSMREQNTPIPLEWARQRIAYLDDLALTDRRSAASLRRERIELSKKYSLLCRSTTFIAVEHRSEQERNAGQPALRRVPLMLARGWGGIEPSLCRQERHEPFRQSWSAPEIQRSLRRLDVQQISESRLLEASERCQIQKLRSRRDTDHPRSISPADATTDSVFALLQKQASNGKFVNVDEAVARFVRTPREVTQQIRDAVGQAGHSTDDDVVDTVLAMLLLAANCQDATMIKRAGDKAIRFLARRLDSPRTVIVQLLKELQARFEHVLRKLQQDGDVEAAERERERQMDIDAELVASERSARKLFAQIIREGWTCTNCGKRGVAHDDFRLSIGLKSHVICRKCGFVQKPAANGKI